MKDIQRDSDAHAYDNVMDAIDAETLEKKKSSRRPYPVVTPTGQIHDQVMETDETSNEQIYQPRSSVSSDPFSASFISEGGGPLVNKSSNVTRQSSNLAPSSINRDSLSKDSEGMYPSLERTDSSPSKDSFTTSRENSQKRTSSNKSKLMAFGAVNPAYRQSFRESDNTSDMRHDYTVNPDTGLRQSSVFATNASAESPSLHRDSSSIENGRVSRLRESFTKKSRRFEKTESVASGDYYPLMHDSPRSPMKQSSVDDGSPITRITSTETYTEQANVMLPEKKRESFVFDEDPTRDYTNDEDSKSWDEYEKDKDRKVSPSTNLKTIAEDVRLSPANYDNMKDEKMNSGDNTVESNDNKRESFNIERHIRETIKPRESQQQSFKLNRQISEDTSSYRNSSDSYYRSSFQEGFVPNAPPPPKGKSVPQAPAPPSSVGTIPQVPPPPPLPGYITPTL